MNTKELFMLVKLGVNPIVKFKENVYEYLDESVDAHMMGKITDATVEYEDSIRFRLDLNGFESHNKNVAQCDWRDDNNEPRLTWFETSYYPKDGIEYIYLPTEIDAPLEIVDEKSLLSEYFSSKSEKTYIEWLEDQVLSLRTN